MRGILLPMGCLRPIFGFIAVIAVLVATVVYLHSHPTPVGNNTGAVLPLQDSALARVLARCQVIGDAAKDDARCEAAWAENRRRLFTYRQPPKSPTAASAANPPVTIKPGDK